MLARPLTTAIVTQDAYDRIVYQQQVKTSGMAVQQGKTLGTSITADDKGGTLNVGSFGIGRAKRVAVQGTVNYKAEDGFVKLFVNEKYQKTLSFGGTALWFRAPKKSFADEDRQKLHNKLRKERKEDAAYWSAEANDARWKLAYTEYKGKLASFRKYRKLFGQWLTDGLDNTVLQAYLRDGTFPPMGADRLRWYDKTGKNLGREDTDDMAAQELYLKYLKVEQDVLPLLDVDLPYSTRTLPEKKAMPKQKWASLTYQEEVQRLKDLLVFSGDSAQYTEAWLTKRLMLYWLEADRKRLSARASRYDSLQHKVNWTGQTRFWTSLSVFYNTVKQPIFSAANKKQTYADEIVDDYFKGELAMNWLWETGVVNSYVSAGAGLDNMLVFSKKNLLTYQTSSRQATGIGNDSALVVTQKQLYAAVPPGGWYVNPHVQAAFTVPQWQNVGLSLSADFLVNLTQAKAQNQYSYRAGIFIPVQTTKSTLLLMPQIRWKNTDQPNPWTFGFSLTASVPGLLK